MWIYFLKNWKLLLLVTIMVGVVVYLNSFCSSCKQTRETELVAAYSKTIEAMYAKQVKLQDAVSVIETDAMERILTNEENVDSFLDNVNTGAYRVRISTDNKAILPKDDTTAGTCPANDTYISSRALHTIERLRAKENLAIERLNLCYKAYNANLSIINGD